MASGRVAGFMTRSMTRSATLAVIALLALCGGPALADPDALWRIVSELCVPDQLQNRDPAPCSVVDLDGGQDHGYVVFKDTTGARQYLLMPTARITGIESPALLAPGATNYFAAAWEARSFTEARAGGTLPRDWISLAVNSAVSRSQNQLHIHIDCLRADVHEALRRYGAAVGASWAPFPVPLAGHTYTAIAVPGEELTVNPFVLLADTMAGARADMGINTVVVVGATDDVRGGPGFIVLADRADGETGDFAGGEALQDHETCPAPLPPGPATAK